MVKAGGALSATAYLLSQEELIRGLEATSEVREVRTAADPVQ